MFRSRGEAIDYLMRHGNLSVPCSPYGNSTYDCAQVAYDVALIFQDDGHQLTKEMLEDIMCYVVNGSDSVQSLIEEHGTPEMKAEHLGVTV